MVDVKTWKCPNCGKVITSIYERQFEQNKKAHRETHNIEQEKNE